MKPESTPTLIIDTREQTPLVFTNLPSRPGTLQTGDYSLAGCEETFAVERKSISDLVGCCVGENRERFERELHRLRGYRFARLLIVGLRLEIGQHRYRSNISPASILGSLAAWEIRYDVPVVWANTPEAAALLVERWAHYFAREVLKQAEAITKAAREDAVPSNDYHPGGMPAAETSPDAPQSPGTRAMGIAAKPLTIENA